MVRAAFTAGPPVVVVASTPFWVLGAGLASPPEQAARARPARAASAAARRIVGFIRYVSAGTTRPLRAFRPNRPHYGPPMALEGVAHAQGASRPPKATGHRPQPADQVRTTYSRARDREQ